MLKAPVEHRELGFTTVKGGGAGLVFWSPASDSAAVDIEGKGLFPMKKTEYGYWEVFVDSAVSGDRYMIVAGNGERIPDPASLSQPLGVHGPSEIVDTSGFSPAGGTWKGVQPSDLIIYELHTGTFTQQGNFEGIASRLEYLSDLGINAIELMPVNQFPGSRNWGYDGVQPFAVQNSYGGARGLARLVQKCHQHGIAVILDVVYNHLGPEGNYLLLAGPYFTSKYNTPWGKAINFDDTWCDGVRRYFIENALMWMRDFGIDGLRLDAVHAIKDSGAVHFISELSAYVDKLNDLTGKNHFIIGECDLNDKRYIMPLSEKGLGLDAQWCDEFHHALHSVLTEERNGYYADFGSTSQMVDSFNNAFVYTGQFSEHRKRVFGTDTEGIPGDRFVVFAQNHDQTGNRMLGERLTSLVDFESLKLAAGAVFISPFVPLIFMGEEYGETNPFLYFTSHGDENLVEAVREGRKREFADFMTDAEPPDPQSEETFRRSVLSWEIAGNERRDKLLRYYKKLISMKREIAAFKPGNRENVRAFSIEGGRAVLVNFAGNPGITALLNFSGKPLTMSLFSESKNSHGLILYSSHNQWGGPVHDSKSPLNQDGSVNIYPYSLVIMSANGEYQP